MDPIKVKLPEEIPNCAFTQDTVTEAVQTVCGHFFERKRFEEYGGKHCIVCKEEVTWYAAVPDGMWGEEVMLQPLKLDPKSHPIEEHHDQDVLEMGIACNLVLIALAHGDEDFETWCRAKNSRITAALDYDKPKKEANIKGLKKYPAFVKSLFEGFHYTKHDSIQAFINAFFKEKSNFEIYNYLAKQVYLDQIQSSVETLWGQRGSRDSVKEEEILAGVERGKKIRALIGLTFSLCLIMGIARRLLGKAS